MPKLAINFKNTVMYKLVCNDLEVKDLYVGHTTDFRKRKSNHKSRCYVEGGKKYHYKVYQFIRNNGGWNNWSMIEIEKYTCNDVNEAKARERFLIESLEATLNIVIPSRTKSEYEMEHREKNREHCNANRTKYQAENFERLHEMINCNCGGIFMNMCSWQHLRSKKHIRYIDNVELPKKNNYYTANRERLCEKNDCPCGGKYTLSNKLTHSKTTTHLAYLKSQFSEI
jgi:hypothetical protein